MTEMTFAGKDFFGVIDFSRLPDSLFMISLSNNT
eukprot:CAMPEP_0201518216 /NCGR_PEP_ID=MMETSP0161_2-20130828/9117_1 /ASSEMBLY_ACC=CAM_ASM_000251 /TAXON_ID=180227 /ORGANISM="Neoparamoeba aestuarina, Strain SoJaBio B1-5/56/2" /LENGTH=33 /DNA_ID= /DNA_START= /DNA_END= /DNA_ORIENTATION=